MQIIPQIWQDHDSHKFYIVTAVHKQSGRPKTKYDVTAQIELILKLGIDAFVKEVEKKAEEEKGLE